jgi:hypothetical protein
MAMDDINMTMPMMLMELSLSLKTVTPINVATTAPLCINPF